ncbi:MAG TPA: PAS domain S-box protein, partial [Candidatus Acidoferrales bacterium]
MGQEEAAPQSNLKPAADGRWRLLESAPDAILIVDRTGRIAFVNSHAEKMFGYLPDELLGQTVEVLVPEAARTAHVAHRSEFGRTPRTREMGSGLELEGRRKDGSTLPVEISLSPLEEPEGQFVVSAIRDVTERRQIQEALRLSEERFRRLVDEVKDYAIFMLDPEGKVKTWNEGAERIKGYRADEIIGQHFSRFYSSEDVERGKPEEQLRIAVREGRSQDDGWRIRKDGSRFWASVVITALRDERGELRGFGKITRDLTERRRNEESLRHSEERFRLMVDAVKDYAIFMLDGDGRVVSWNPGAERIKGYSAAEIVGQHLSVFYPEEARRRRWPEQQLATAREHGRAEDESLRVRKDGSTFWAHVVMTPVRDATGTLRGYAKVVRDLTDRKRIEALEKAERQTNEFL